MTVATKNQNSEQIARDEIDKRLRAGEGGVKAPARSAAGLDLDILFEDRTLDEVAEAGAHLVV